MKIAGVCSVIIHALLTTIMDWYAHLCPVPYNTCVMLTFGLI